MEMGLPASGGFVVPPIGGRTPAASCGWGASAAAPGTWGPAAVGRPSGIGPGVAPVVGDGGATVDGRLSGTGVGTEPGEDADGRGGIGPSASRIVGTGAVREAAGAGGSAPLLPSDDGATGVMPVGPSVRGLELAALAGAAAGTEAVFAAVNGDDPLATAEFRVPRTVISVLPLSVFKMTL